jgi:hypothetical protein
MADVKISQLPAATTPVDGTEVLPIVQSATTKQVSIANLTAGRAMAASSLTLTTPLAVTSGGTGLATTAAGTLLSSTALNTISATATPTLGVAGTTAGSLGLSGSSSGVVTLNTAAAAGTWSLTLPTSGGTNGFILTTNGAGVTTWTNPTALGVDLDVGTTAITGGTTGRVLYNNAGVLGEYAVTGTGSVVLGTSPTFTTSAIFPAGTVSAPGITTTGDTNTGIYFPAADTLAITTAGSEDMRFTPEGNVTLNSATFSPTTPGTAGNMAMTGTLAMGSSFLRNRIINGNMQIDQRNAGASVTPATGGQVFITDRFSAFVTQSTKLTSQQSTTAPTGFVNSLLVTSSSAYSVVASDRFSVRQGIEGVNCSDLGWGTASARTVTFSFWVRSSLTGTFGGSLKNSAGNRSYPYTYSISSADTWEYKTITVPGDTTGTWLTDTTGAGIYIIFGLGTGSTFSGTAGAWAGSNFDNATGAVSVVGTNGATWYVTGVQLEVGSIATPFERRQYGTELMLCQRYYEVCGYGIGRSESTSSMSLVCSYAVTKRANPSSIALYNNTTVTNGAQQLGRSGTNITAITNTFQATQTNFGVVINVADTGLTVGAICSTGPVSNIFTANSEL